MRVGTRASALALAQAKLVAERIEGAELCPISSSAETADAPPGEADKSRFVAALQAALVRGEIDLAVHSAKDVPAAVASGLALIATPARAAAEDVLCGAASLDELPAGARVGTSSVRRAAQLRAVREDLVIVPMRGNVDTRLRKLADGDADAIVLARAGLQRLARAQEIGAVLDAERFVPAPGQGTLVLQARAQDERVREQIAALHDADTVACLLAERALARALGASCESALGAHAMRDDAGRLRLRAWAGASDGSEWVRDELTADGADAESLARELAARLELVGARELLAASAARGGAAA
jgi:hydroxymethylbilane synthase